MKNVSKLKDLENISIEKFTEIPGRIVASYYDPILDALRIGTVAYVNPVQRPGFVNAAKKRGYKVVCRAVNKNTFGVYRVK
jgi:predicted O-methyltransferase YrrM